MKWKIGYYAESVKKDIHRFEKSIKANYIAITDRMLEDGPDLGLPHTRAMGQGLFEIRQKDVLASLVHVFIKKTENTP